MVLCEAVIAFNATVNAATANLAALSPTSLTIRDGAYGDAFITHAMAFASTDDVHRVEVIPSGYIDTNGFEVPYIVRYAATASFDMKAAKLAKPIPVKPNTALQIQATSETAANTVVFAWLWIEYRNKMGTYVSGPLGEGLTTRGADATGALTSNVEAAGTAITTLQAGRAYRLAGLSGGGIAAQTAGNVGPVFMKLSGPAEFNGMQCYVPLANSSNYVATGAFGWSDFNAADIKMPVFKAPNTVTPYWLGYTAEQPEARLIFEVDKVWA